MRILHVVLAGAAVAGVAAAGSAFTAGNAMPTSQVVGYGHTAITGATITKITYTPDGTDATKVSGIVFTSSTDVTGRKATLTVTTSVGSTNPVVTKTDFDCDTTTSTYTAGSMDVTCDTTGTSEPAYTDLSDVALTVR